MAGMPCEDKLVEWTETPFKPFDSPRNRVVMIKMPDGFQGIYLLVDHLTMDAQSLIVFPKDVIEIYCNMKYEGSIIRDPWLLILNSSKKTWRMNREARAPDGTENSFES